MSEAKREYTTTRSDYRGGYWGPRPTHSVNSVSTSSQAEKNTSQKKLPLDNLRNRLKRTYSREEIFEIWEDQNNLRDQRESEERQRREARAKARKQKVTNLIICSKRKLGEAVASYRKLSLKIKITYIGLVLAGALLVVLFFVPAKQSGQVQQTDTSAVASATTQPSGQAQSNTQKQPAAVSLPIEEPDFELLYPGGDKVSFGPTIRRISPSDRAPVYVIVDDFEGIKINVSQQELPESFKSDVAGSTKKMAQDFQAANVLKTDDADVYHGWSARDGVHSIILVKEKLLLLVRAERQLSEAQIAAYIASLQ